MISENIILIPIYEPTDKFEDFIKVVAKHFETILVVNDGSSAKYNSMFERISKMPGVVVLNHNTNLGKGRALKTGFCYSLGIKEKAFNGGVITVDGDGQHKIEDILKVSNALSSHPDMMVLGCRTFDDKTIPFRSRFGNIVSKKIYKFFCGIDVSDTQTGLRGIPRKYIERCCQIEGERYEYETSMLINAKNDIDFYEVPILTIYEDNNNVSHFNPLKDSIRIYSLLLKYSLSSLLSVLIDYSVFGFLVQFGSGVWISTYIARGCSAVVNFGVNRNVVFKYKGSLPVQFFKYVTLVFLSGTISAGIIYFVEKYFSWNIIAIKILVELVLFFMNYYIQRTYIFAKKRGETNAG